MKVDRHYAARASGPARKTLHCVRRVLEARRNGVVSFFSAYLKGRTLLVSTRNTRPDKITVSRVLMIGPRGGLSLKRKNGRRYIKAAQLGKGSL